MPIRRVIAILFAALALALPSLGSAQSERGTITGVVEGATKAGLPGVLVKVINTATNATTEVVSSSAGIYQSSIVDGVRLSAGSTQRINVTLGVGAITENVSVVATSSMLQSQDAKVTTGNTPRQMQLGLKLYW
jgi:hypothetical protein